MIRTLAAFGSFSNDMVLASGKAAVVSVPAAAIANVLADPSTARLALAVAILSFLTPFAALLCRHLTKKWKLRDKDE